MVKKLSKTGFTLIEILAVTIILSLLIVIAVPNILGTMENSKKKSLLIDSKIVAKVLEGEKIENRNFDPKSIKLDVLPSLINKSTDNYDSIYVSVENDEVRLAIIGRNKWDGLIACGTYNDMKILEDESACDLIPASTPATCFTFDSTTNTITDYSEAEECPRDVIIPRKIDEVSVIHIGDDAFNYKQLTSVIIPSTVKSIGTYAFSYNEITSVNIPSSVTNIEEGAFADSQLVNVIIPNSITNIKEYVFGDNQLTSVTIPNSVTNIGDSAFAWNQLTSVTIPNSVISIEYGAFNGNELTSVNIPNSVTSIGNNAFAWNQLTSVTIPNSVTNIGSIVNSSGVNSGSFMGNQLTNITIPNSVTIIGNQAFQNNKLTSISIPNSVVSIGGGAFNSNQLPDNQAFIYKRNNDGTEDKSTLVSYGGANRNNVIIPNDITNIVDSALLGNGISNVTIPDGVTNIGKWAFGNNELSSVIIPNTVTSMGEYAFYGNNLSNVTISNNIPNIENYTFAFNLLTSVSIPNGVTRIGDSAFWSCGLESVTIPNSVTIIDRGAFDDNYLTSIIIGTGVTTIGSYAFGGNQLTDITIPSNVTSIGNSAFYKSNGQYNESNPNLTSIINTTQRSFDWGSIINNSSGYNFVGGTVVNSAGNVTISDALRPTITILGSNPIAINVGDTYVDAGATANDLQDGNLTSHIQTNNPVNTGVAGSYSVTYTVTDNDSYTSTATRTVIVRLRPSYVANVNKLPVFGVDGVGTYPASGWTSVQNSSGDDSNVNVPLPFNISMFGTSYNSVYVGSNGYLTFGGGSGNYSSLSASNPAYNKIHFGSSDNSYQRVSYISTANYVRIRYEGTASSSGTVGSPNIVVEFTLFNPTLTSGNTTIEMLVGNHNRTSGATMIANDNGSINVPYTLTASTSYVFAGDSTGNNFDVYKSNSVSGVDY